MQINIAKVYNAGAGKKYGSVHDASGAKYLLPAGMAGVFQAGQVVDVPIKVENWDDRDNPGQKKPVHIINGRPGAAGAGVVAQPTPVMTPVPQAHPPGGPAAAPQFVGARMDSKDGAIFVTGIVGRAIGSGKFETQDIKLLALAAVDAWNEVKGKL